MDIVELAQGNPTDQPRLLEALVKDNYESIVSAYMNRWTWAEITESLIPTDWLDGLTARQISSRMAGYAVDVERHTKKLNKLRQEKNKRLVREYVELCAAAGELSGQIPCPHIDYGESHEPEHTD
jgi:hypothetical protein